MTLKLLSIFVVGMGLPAGCVIEPGGRDRAYYHGDHDHGDRDYGRPVWRG